MKRHSKKLNVVFFCGFMNVFNLIMLKHQMQRFHFIIVIFFVSLSCKNEIIDFETIYNQRTNKLIEQVLEEESCDCLLEIPNQSIIEISHSENPHFSKATLIIKKLNLRDQKQLDTLEKISKKFILDTDFLKQKGIKIIKRNSISDIIKDGGHKLLKKCPNGVLSFQKPILDKELKIAVVDCNIAFGCLSSPLRVYHYKNERWVYDRNYK